MTLKCVQRAFKEKETSMGGQREAKGLTRRGERPLREEIGSLWRAGDCRCPLLSFLPSQGLGPAFLPHLLPPSPSTPPQPHSPSVCLHSPSSPLPPFIPWPSLPLPGPLSLQVLGWLAPSLNAEATIPMSPPLEGLF